jgi:FlgO protein
MHPRKLAVGLVSVCLSLMLGCAAQQTAARPDSWDGNLVKVGYRIADTLADNATQVIGPSDTLIVASFVSVNNLEQSSSFGRMMAEQVASSR